MKPLLLTRIVSITAVLVLSALGWVPAATANDCKIEGPDCVAAFTRFALCAKGKEHNWSFDWSGPALGARTGRCVEVLGLPPGTYRFTLLTTDKKGKHPKVCTHCVKVKGPDIGCSISGPTRVDAGHAFELCGPDDDAAGWHWSGPGIPAAANERCVTIAGLTPGIYVFTLHRGAADSCTIAVTIAANDSGPGPGPGPEPGARGACPAPLTFWQDQCINHGARSGGFIGDDWMQRIASCVDDRSEAFSWTDDATSFCAVIASTSLRPRDLLRQQLAALLANRCAFDLGLIHPAGFRVGLDATARFACTPLDTGRVDSLARRAVALLDRCANPRTAPADCAEMQIALTLCLARVNRGPDTCAVLFPSMTRGSNLVADASGVALARPEPNPFSTSMRLAFALPSSAPVDVAVHDLAGRRIRTLARGLLGAGAHELRWDGRDESGARVRAGVYFVRGRIGARPLTVRLVRLQ